MTRETAIGRLMARMLDESEVYWGSSWGDEYQMWECEPASRPMLDEDPPEPTKLKELASIAGGWFVWSEDEEDIEFVPMDRWLLMYDQWRARPWSGSK